MRGTSAIEAMVRQAQDGQALFDRLEARGHRMRRADDGSLMVADAGRLSAADRDAIREHRQQLIDMCEYRETFGRLPLMPALRSMPPRRGST
jgi:uncharacterized membrane protein YccC